MRSGAFLRLHGSATNYKAAVSPQGKSSAPEYRLQSLVCGPRTKSSPQGLERETRPSKAHQPMTPSGALCGLILRLASQFAQFVKAGSVRGSVNGSASCFLDA